MGEDEELVHPNLTYIGHVAVFYVPTFKLEDASLGVNGLAAKEIFAAYFMDNFNAFTLGGSNVQGFWREHEKANLFVDINSRYEISFSGKDNVEMFVDFLSDMCTLIEEESIYVVMGYKSWLVWPKEDRNVILGKVQELYGRVHPVP